MEKLKAEKMDLEERMERLNHEMEEMIEANEHYVVEDIMRDVNAWINDC